MSARANATLLHPDRLFPADRSTRTIARRLFASVVDMPILSPHGHTEAQWFAENQPFPNPTALFLEPDHYLFRMLYSQGVSMEAMGIPTRPEHETATPKPDPREAWRLFAVNYHLFRGTPSRLWLDYAFAELFGLTSRLSAETADHYYDHISEQLATPAFLPRTLYERFRIEVLATTDAATSTLAHHEALRNDATWQGRIVPTFRPDAVVDPGNENFASNLQTPRRAHRRRHAHLGWLPERTAKAPRILQAAGRHGY